MNGDLNAKDAWARLETREAIEEKIIELFKIKNYVDSEIPKLQTKLLASRRKECWLFLHDWSVDLRQKLQITTEQFMALMGLPEDHILRIALYPRKRNFVPRASDPEEGHFVQELKDAYLRYDPRKECPIPAASVEEKASDWYMMNYEELHRQGVKALFFESDENDVLNVLCLLEKDAPMPYIPFICSVTVERTTPLVGKTD